MAYLTYSVQDGDIFDIENYPQLQLDLKKIQQATVNVPKRYKSEIVISFTRNHSMAQTYLDGNPELTGLVISGVLPVQNIESLFEASAQHQGFRFQLEEYLKDMLT